MRRLLALLLCFALADSELRAETLGDSLGEGWNTWRAASSGEQGMLCCFTWSQGRATPKHCDLDAGHSGYGSHDGRADTTGEIQVFAYVQDGTPTKIRALSPQCPVTSNTPVLDLGLVDVDESADWLARSITPGSAVSPDAMLALAAHDGEQPPQILRRVARGDDEELREEAIFALGQLPAESATRELIALVEDRALPMPAREDALFWLVQSDNDDAFNYLSTLIVGR